MSSSLPERPDLDQLRRQAKELRDAARRGDPAAAGRFARHHPLTPQDPITLAAAQLVIARELGFASWPRLKAAIVARTSTPRGVSALLAACIDGRLRQASDILGGDPGLAHRDLRVAAVLGDSEAARELMVDPASAVAIDGDRGWPPLLYACYSRWHQIEPGRALGLAEVVSLLLGAGASPNTNDGGRPRYRSALKGSAEVNNPEVTEVLLEAGANPNPGEPIAEAVGHRDNRCLQLLLAHGARVERTWALGAAVYNDNAVAMSLLLDALAASGSDVASSAASQVLPEAAANASLPVVAALLDAGADPNTAGDDGVSALRLAVRGGKHETATRLRAAGATDDVTNIDRFLGACLDADRQTAEQLIADHPDLRDRLSDGDRTAIVDAADSGRAEAVALMLDLGFSPGVRRFGEQALHTAAYWGNAAVVRVLLDRGAEVDARDERFDGTPLGFATVGSGEQAGKPGDWIETVKLLVEAGAAREDVWVSDKPPSEEVMDLLRHYGIGPAKALEQEPDDHGEVPGSVGIGIMADIARHLEAAHRDRDLDLLGSLLHEQVSWTGVCGNKEQVLGWYRMLIDDGTLATVESVEVDRDAVILGLSVSRTAEGAHPAPPQQVWQVFTVVDAQIVDIRAYPDLTSARSR